MIGRGGTDRPRAADLVRASGGEGRRAPAARDRWADADWVSVGRVGRPHGLDGSFVVERPSEEPERFAVGARVYVEREPRPGRASKQAGGRPPRDPARPARGARRRARGARVAELPPPEEGSYYVFQLVGLAVEDEGGRDARQRARRSTRASRTTCCELDSGHRAPARRGLRPDGRSRGRAHRDRARVRRPDG